MDKCIGWCTAVSWNSTSMDFSSSDENALTIPMEFQTMNRECKCTGVDPGWNGSCTSNSKLRCLEANTEFLSLFPTFLLTSDTTWSTTDPVSMSLLASPTYLSPNVDAVSSSFSSSSSLTKPVSALIFLIEKEFSLSSSSSVNLIIW